MFAIDDSTSIDWAREMRGTASMASAVTPRSVSSVNSRSFCAGASRLTRVAPERSRPTSSSVGTATFITTSLDQAASPSTRSAPASA